MKLLLLTPGYAADENDHNCIPPLQLLVRELGVRGVEVHIIALEYPFRSDPYVWHHAKVYPCNGQNRKWLKIRTSYRAKRWAHALHEQYKFDALHTFWLNRTTQIGIEIAEKTNLPHYITCMGQDVLNPNPMIVKRIQNAPLQHQVIVLSKFHDEKLFAACGIKAKHRIPWGIEPLPKVVQESTNRKIDILGVGSLLSVKNWSKWLQVIKIVTLHKPDLHCILIGDGILRKKLEAEATQLGLLNNVTFAGNLPRQKVLTYLQKAKILLHTSDFESFGFVLLEAQACGCAIVCTRVGIAPELVNVKVNEFVADLADDLLKTLLNENTSNEDCQTTFTVENCVEHYIQFNDK
jgi:glycosyltransferase involved in cell wall biosynthesis